jgi:hypothetical protein
MTSNRTGRGRVVTESEAGMAIESAEEFAVRLFTIEPQSAFMRVTREAVRERDAAIAAEARRECIEQLRGIELAVHSDATDETNRILQAANILESLTSEAAK